MQVSANLSRDLAAPVKSFRIMAIEQALYEGHGDETLRLLRDRLRVEDDEECTLLLRHAIAAVEQRSAPAAPVHEADGAMDALLAPPTWPELYVAANAAARLQLLNRLPGADKGPQLEFATARLADEPDPAVLAALVRTFADHWTTTALDVLVGLVGDKRHSVRLAALQVLSRRDPQRLLAAMPRLLVADDPCVRALAIQGLIGIDAQEALLHLEQQLLSADDHHRRAGLGNAIFLPYEDVRGLLLRFLAGERDPELLEQAGRLIEINGDIEAPYRLWEIIERSPTQRVAKLKAILNQWTQSLGNVLDPTELAAFRERLRGWITQRVATRYVQQVAGLLTNGTRPDAAMEQAVRDNLARPEVQAAFAAAADWPLQPAVKAQLARWLETATGTRPPAAGKPTDLPTPSHDEQVRRLAFWPDSDVDGARAAVATILANRDGPHDLRATALRMAARLALADFVDQAESLLRTGDENLTTAVIEYLGRCDPDRLLPHMGRFLKADSLRVRSLAISTLQHLDPGQARSALSALLHARIPEERDLALACMVNFEFATVRDLLADFLGGAPGDAQFDAGLCLFQANPDTENLFPLFRLEQLLPHERAQRVQHVRLQNEELLDRLGVLPPGQREERLESWQSRFKQEQARAKTPAPAYSVRALQARTPTAVPRTGPVDSEGASTRWQLALSIGVVVLLLWILMPNSAPEIDPNRTGPMLAGATEATGQIRRIDADGNSMLVVTEQGIACMLICTRRDLAGVRVGDKVEFSGVPFRKYPDGLVLMQSRKIRRL